MLMDFHRRRHILKAALILFCFTTNFIQLSLQQLLTVDYQPKSICSTNNSKILVGTTISFQVTIQGILLWAAISINNNQLHLASESYQFQYKFDTLGPATVSTITDLNQISWNVNFDVVKLNPNDITWLPKWSDGNSLKTNEDIEFSLNTNCIIYNNSLISLTVDGNTYKNTQFTHRFSELSGSDPATGQIRLNYPSDTDTVTERIYTLYNAIENFQVLPGQENGCINQDISIEYQVGKGSGVVYAILNNPLSSMVKLINQGENTFTFEAKNPVSTETKTFSFHTVDGVRARVSPNRSSIIIGEIVTGALLSDNVEGIKWYYKLTTVNVWTLIQSSTNSLNHSFTNPGQYDIMVALGDINTNQCKQRWIIDVLDPGPSKLDIINAKAPPNPNVLTRIFVNIYNNSKLSQLKWYYKDTVIDECFVQLIPISSVIQFSCDVLLNSDTEPLDVSLTSIDNSYNYWESIKPFSKIKIWPRVIQMGYVTNLHISTSGNNLCVRWMEEINENICSGWYHSVRENSIGTLSVDARAFNAISDLSITQSIIVVDISEFVLSKSDSEIVNGENVSLVMLSNKIVGFKLDKTTPSTSYQWILSVPNGIQENITVSYSNKSSVVIVNSDIPEMNADIWNLGITITAMLDGGPWYKKIFNVSVYQEITNLEHTLESYYLLVDERYDFNITWHGTKAHCGTSFSSSSILTNITQYGTHCNIVFHTNDTPNKWTLPVEIKNEANIKTLTFELASYYFFTNFSVKCSEISVPNALAFFNIIEQMPDTYFNWTMTNESHYIAYMGNTSDFSYKIPTELHTGNYTIAINATGHLLLNKSLSTTCLLRILTEKLYLRISDPVAIPSVFGDVNVTASIGRRIPLASFKWYLLEPSEHDQDKQFQDLLEHENSTMLYFNGDESEGLYTIKLRAKGIWIFGSCYDGNEKIDNCVDQNITFLLCLPSPALIEYGMNRTIQKSSWFHSLISITSKCVIQFNWSNIAECISPSNCITTYQPKHLPGMTPVLNSPAIELPPGAFDAGKYQLKCELVIDGFSINNITISLTVIDTPLIPYIDGGSTRTVGSLNNVVLNASLTKDPDTTINGASQLFYRWELNQSSCFLNERRSDFIHGWSSDNVALVAKENCLIGNSSFDATMYVKRDSLDNMEMEQSFKQEVLITIWYHIFFSC